MNPNFFSAAARGAGFGSIAGSTVGAGWTLLGGFLSAVSGQLLASASPAPILVGAAAGALICATYSVRDSLRRA